MNPASLFRLLASLGLLCLLSLPACMAKNAPAPTPGGGRGAAAPADAPARMGTRADYGGGYTANAPSSAPAPESYGGDAGYGEVYEEAAPVYDSDDSAVATTTAPRRHRPGLGTSYGEQHFSRVTTAPFVRGTSEPDVLLSLWYDDPQGVRLAQGTFGHGFDRSAQSSTTDGAFVVSIVDEWGNVMSAADVGNKRYVVGEAGQRYKLRIQNNSAFRFEVVASVDGLDVVDGQPASFVKRGYILDPWSAITVDGWRTSEDSVAAFRFSGMEDSYAERKGQGRNIGVMGFAFFHERGGVPWHELSRRNSADPFPNRFAEPPPPRRWR